VSPGGGRGSLVVVREFTQAASSSSSLSQELQKINAFSSQLRQADAVLRTLVGCCLVCSYSRMPGRQDGAGLVQEQRVCRLLRMYGRVAKKREQIRRTRL
jgi:hypothetical protein